MAPGSTPRLVRLPSVYETRNPSQSPLGPALVPPDEESRDGGPRLGDAAEHQGPESAITRSSSVLCAAHAAKARRRGTSSFLVMLAERS